MLTIPANSTVFATVIFLHGLGQTSVSWLPWVQRLANDFPHVKWILPQAETGHVTYNGQDRPRWFDVHALPPGPEEDDTLTAEASKQHIQSIIADVIGGGVPAHQVFLVGFSQGSAIAMLSGLTSQHKLGGIAVLAGWLPLKLREVVLKAKPALCSPIFWAHGTDDEEIPLQNALETIKWLRSSLDTEQAGFTYREYPGLKHDVNDDVLRDLKAWLSKLL